MSNLGNLLPESEIKRFAEMQAKIDRGYGWKNFTITVKIASAYGNEHIYPVCEKAKLFAKFIGQKTLTRQNLEVIKELGYAIEVEAPKL